MRFLLATLCIASTTLLTSWYEYLIQIAFLISILFLLSTTAAQARHLCWRNWQLLRWILLPTLVLHSIFTPGALIFPDFFIPISHEGLQLGVQLALHWATVFTLAMLLGHLFTIEQWLQGVARLPWLYHILYPYLCLFPRMNLWVRVLIRRYYRQWNLLSWRQPLHKLAQLPEHLLDLLLHLQHRSQQCATSVWQHWGQSISSTFTQKHTLNKQYFPHSIALMCLWMWMDLGVFH